MPATDETNEPLQDLSGSVWAAAERIAKFGTTTLAVVYTFGFLVVATAHARYGIVMFDLFRARVLAAGLLITLLIVLPVVSGIRVYNKLLATTNKLDGLLSYVVIAVIFLWITILVACEFYPLFPGNSRTVLHVSSTVAWWILTGTSASLLAVPLPKRLSFLFAMLLVLTLVYNFCIFVMFSKALLGLAIWLLFFTSAPGILTRFITKEKTEGRTSEWYITAVVYGLVAVIAFTHLLYFKIKPAWGGGLPQRVTINLTKPIPFSNPGNVQAFLIDETDRGYYLTHNTDDHKASFVPRDAVGSIDFEEVK